MNKNDTNIAYEIAGLYDVRVACDDGSVHVYTKNKNTAEEVVKHFGHKKVSDGVQGGSVFVWFDGEIINQD